MQNEENKEAVKQAVEAMVNTMPVVNKRIDFDQRTMKRLNTMLPLYKEEAGVNIKNSELLSYVVCLAVNKLFEGDFKSKLEEL